MKKLRIFVLLFILAFSFSVKAEVLLEIDCDGSEISKDKIITCEAVLLYEKEGINDIEFNYNTNLDINFLAVNGFSITNNNGRVSIHTDKALYDEIMNATTIMKFTLSMNDKSFEKDIFTISNITINKDDSINVDGISKEFNVLLPKVKLDNVCTLDSITVEREIIKDFSKDKLEYRDINVTSDVIFIDAVRTSDKSSATGLGDVRVPRGKTIERNITVTAEDGTQKVYKLYITNVTINEEVQDEIKPDEITKSSDNTLKLLELYQNNKKIEIAFDSSKEIYNIELPDEIIDKLTIKATLNDNKASFVKNYGPRDIKISYGYNKELIKIKAENGKEKIITLNINYHDNRDKDNTLKSLIINGQVVDLTKDKLEVKLANNIDKTSIEAIANSNKSTVKYEDIDLILGDNEVNIEVTSEDGVIKEYDVNVIREEEHILLNSITVKGYDLGFSKDRKIYDLKINIDTKLLDIIINPSSVKHEILNNENLKNGSKIIIQVTDDEDSYEYTINIQKENNFVINIICYLVFGIGIISFIASIVYVIKKKNNILKRLCVNICKIYVSSKNSLFFMLFI